MHLCRGEVEEHERPAVDVVIDHELGEVGAVLQIGDCSLDSLNIHVANHKIYMVEKKREKHTVTRMRDNSRNLEPTLRFREAREI